MLSNPGPRTLLTYIVGFLAAVGLVWSAVEASIFVADFFDWSSTPRRPNGVSSDLSNDRAVRWIATILAALVLLAIVSITVGRTRRRDARGAAYLNTTDGFVHLAAEILGATAGQSVLDGNGRSEKSDAEQMRNKILEYITKGSGRRREFQCMYLVPRTAGSRRRRTLVPLFHEGLPESQMDQFEVDIDETIYGRTLRSKRAQRIRDCRRDPRCQNAGLDPSTRSMICIPIEEPEAEVHNAVFCVLSTRRTGFTDLDEALFRNCVSVILLLGIIDGGRSGSPLGVSPPDAEAETPEAEPAGESPSESSEEEG